MGWMRLDHALPWTQPPGLTLSSTFERPERRERGPGETMVTEVWPLGRHPPSGLQTRGTVHGMAEPFPLGGRRGGRGRVSVVDEESRSRGCRTGI